jgi:hypothetical protein
MESVILFKIISNVLLVFMENNLKGLMFYLI